MAIWQSATFGVRRGLGILLSSLSVLISTNLNASRSMHGLKSDTGSRRAFAHYDSLLAAPFSVVRMAFQDVPAPQPPAGPGGCRGPDCAPAPPPEPPRLPQVPRDEIVLSLDLPSEGVRANADTSELIDFTHLNGSDIDIGIDQGVTSGGDVAAWDEISVDRYRSDGCTDASHARAGDKSAAAVCDDAKNKSDTKK